ncbi:MAG: hypothetical protein H6832_07080 [Planctomycetes bacterium]|nr:hypothetical protein [Planctomycetota bacterium]MCB9890333.1 hypothetical protein [Planctomycetota bacterium]MCB9918151.1 hypothetical protein [Planctomycetota bacterium]
MQTTLPRFLALTAVIAAFGSPSAQLAAQDGQTVQHARRTKTPVLLSIHFVGGSLSMYLQELRSAHKKGGGETLNMIVTGKPDAIQLPRFDLEDTTVDDAIQVLERIEIDHSTRIQVTSQAGRGTPDGSQIYLVNARTVEKTQRGPAEKPTLTRVLSIRQLTTPLPNVPPDSVLKLETVLGAIEAGLEVLDEADGQEKQGTATPSAVLRFHESSGLLFLKGSPEQLNIVESVIARLEFDLLARNRHAPGMRATPGGAGAEPATEAPVRAENSLKKTR